MYIIVGLGNPESDYEGTRHNIGFDVVNEIAKQYNIEIEKKKFRALCGSFMLENEKIILIKPQTYMNLSGESVLECKNFYKIENSRIIIISDDIDLKPRNNTKSKKRRTRHTQWSKINSKQSECRRFP